MVPWERLTQRGQQRRLRRLAAQALDAFGQSGTLVALDLWENATFQVRGREGRFLLRVHRPGYRTRAQIESELALLDGLRGEGLVAQRPVRTPAGEGTVLVSTPGVPEPRVVSMLTWVDGSFRARRPGRTRLRRVGRLVGRLHAFARDTALPDGFDRPTFAERVVTVPPPGHPMRALRPDADWQRLLDAAAAADAELAALDLDHGLIHSDLHFQNLLFTGDRVVPIDWDDCVTGPLLFDLGIPWERAGIAHGAAGQDAVLAGYREVMPLRDDAPSLLPRVLRRDSFTAAHWVARRFGTPAVRAAAPRILDFVFGRI